MSRDWLSSGAVERLIDADPYTIYTKVTDVTSTGQRSDECRSAEWLVGDPSDVTAGARFRGHNRSRLARWSRVCEVIEATPGRAFAFRTVPERWDVSRRDSTTWRYDLTPVGHQTLVRHSYEITKFPVGPFKAIYGMALPQHRDMRPAMGYTLDALADSLSRSEAF
jgi:hypothetical protein